MMPLVQMVEWANDWAWPLGLTGVGLMLAYEQYVRWRIPAHETDDAHGSAHWAGPADLASAGLLPQGGKHAQGQPSQGLWLGRIGKTPLRLVTDRHLCTLAPTRSGKGVSAILPNLLTYGGSVIVIDPKGEAAAITARRRAAMGQAVHVVDPWGITGLPSARFNPLAALSPESPDLAEDAALLAQALVPSGSRGDNHWDNEARALLTGLILHVVTAEPPARRNLGQVRAILTQAQAPFNAMLDRMSRSKAANGLVARAADRLLQKSDRERSGVISTAQSQTHILDAPRLVANLAASDFSFGALKAKPATVFLVLPADRLVAFGRWLRLMITEALTELVRRPGRPDQPVLFVLDEFAALGHLEPVETAMGLLAGYGVQLWPILQDLSQLKDLYPNRWPTFLGNAGVVQSFGVAETVTAAWLSERLGTRTVALRNRSLAGATLGADSPGKYSEAHAVSGRPLMTVDELLRLPADQELLLLPGHPPIKASKLAYFRDKEFAGLFDDNPWRKRTV